MPLLKNTRFYVLIGTAVVATAVWTVIATGVEGPLRATRLAEVYAFLALIYLYVALLATPLTRLWPTMPGRAGYLHARRAIGVSAFCFGLLHTLVSFFGQLDGFVGLGFLTTSYVVSVILGLVALLILALLAALSFDAAIQRLGFPRWKRIQRSIYLAGVLTLVHTLMIGSHYLHRLTPIAAITFVMLVILLALEVPRFLAQRSARP